MAEGSRQDAALGIGFVLIYQTAVVAAVQTAPVLAPFAAAGLGLDADLIGLFTAIIFATALISSTGTAGIVARLGSFHGASVSLAVVALGALSLALAQGSGLVVLGAVLIGIGYGPVNPIGSRLLNRIAVGRHRNLVFSFKQSSVAIGGAAAGFILPVIVLMSNWRLAAIATMALAILIAALSPLVAKRLGQDGLAGVSIRFKLPFAPARDVLKDPLQRGLAIGVFAFSMAQFGFMSIYIAMIWRETNLPPEGAAVMLSLAMTASILGRLYWGWCADTGRPRHVLSWLAWSGVALLVLLLFIGPTWPWIVIALVSVVLGFGPMGWSGVLLAEVARAGEARGGPGGVLTATAGSMVFAYLGGLFGPALLSASVLVTGSYTPGILCLIIAFAVCAVVVLRGTETYQEDTSK